jgi:hypothetical protein
MILSLAWEEVRRSQSHQSHRRLWHRRRTHPRPPHPPPLGPPSRSSTEDYNQKTSSRRRRCPSQRTGGRQVILAGQRAAWKLDGVVRHFLCRLEEKGMMDEEEGWFQRAPGLNYM